MQSGFLCRPMSLHEPKPQASKIGLLFEYLTNSSMQALKTWHGFCRLFKRKQGRQKKRQENGQFAANKWPQLTTNSVPSVNHSHSDILQHFWHKELSYTLLASCPVGVREVPHPTSPGQSSYSKAMPSLKASAACRTFTAIVTDLSRMLWLRPFCGLLTIAFSYGTLNLFISFQQYANIIKQFYCMTWTAGLP